VVKKKGERENRSALTRFPGGRKGLQGETDSRVEERERQIRIITSLTTGTFRPAAGKRKLRRGKA